MPLLESHETLDTMRGLLLLVLVLTACTTQPNAAVSPTPSPTASPTATPTPSPTSSPTASPSPITLPSTAKLSASNGNVIWALVGETRLFVSSDRGDTWQERSTPPGLTNIDIGFASDRDGLILNVGVAATECQTQSVTIWRTGDGAASWQKLTSSGIADALCKSGLAAADATHAFFAATKPGTNPVIYRTADGGASWTASAPLPTPPNIASQGATSITLTGKLWAFGSVVLVDGGGGQQTKDVFRSSDGGATFAYASTVPTFEGAVGYVTATRWLQIAPPSSSRETTDGGGTWHAYTTDYSQAAPVSPVVVFGDATVGYATVRGAIQRTTDGGTHWTTIKTPGTA
jgi:photosystem II stability/assembly factor-like uncharacterized protein